MKLRRFKKISGLVLVLMVFVTTLPADKQATLFEEANPVVSSLPQTQLTIGDNILKVEVAATPQTMARGLMFRSSLAADQGMLFVFPIGHQASFWMKNTSIPLSLAYIDKEGKILEIHSLVPFDETAVKSKSDQVSYALEVNRDWFNTRNIKPGALIRNLPKLEAR